MNSSTAELAKQVVASLSRHFAKGLFKNKVNCLVFLTVI